MGLARLLLRVRRVLLVVRGLRVARTTAIVGRAWLLVVVRV
jgi:hypothetical protein